VDNCVATIDAVGVTLDLYTNWCMNHGQFHRRPYAIPDVMENVPYSHTLWHNHTLSTRGLNWRATLPA